MERVIEKNTMKTIKGCGKRIDALGYIICGEYDDLKHGYKQWLCSECQEKLLGEKE